MKLLDVPIGLLINFHEPKLTDGVAIIALIKSRPASQGSNGIGLERVMVTAEREGGLLFSSLFPLLSPVQFFIVRRGLV